MRVNPNPMPDLMAALNQTELEEQQAELQISTGKSVNEPSDNPTAAALLVENNDQATFTSGYLQSISVVQGQLSTADSTLSSINTALQQALSLGVEAANGTVSPSDQAAIANQLQGIQSQIMSLANTAYEGNYLFGGTVTNTAPFVSGGDDGSGVAYMGNTDVNEVSIGSGYNLAVNVPGSQYFCFRQQCFSRRQQPHRGRPNQYRHWHRRQRTQFGHQLSFRAGRVLGNATDQTQSESTYLNAAKLQISQQQTTLGGADLAAAATDLSQAQTDNQAAIAAIAKLSQDNLFNYLS